MAAVDPLRQNVAPVISEKPRTQREADAELHGCGALPKVEHVVWHGSLTHETGSRNCFVMLFGYETHQVSGFLTWAIVD